MLASGHSNLGEVSALVEAGRAEEVVAEVVARSYEIENENLGAPRGHREAGLSDVNRTHDYRDHSDQGGPYASPTQASLLGQLAQVPDRTPHPGSPNPERSMFSGLDKWKKESGFY